MAARTGHAAVQARPRHVAPAAGKGSRCPLEGHRHLRPEGKRDRKLDDTAEEYELTAKQSKKMLTRFLLLFLRSHVPGRDVGGTAADKGCRVRYEGPVQAGRRPQR